MNEELKAKIEAACAAASDTFKKYDAKMGYIGKASVKPDWSGKKYIRLCIAEQYGEEQERILSAWCFVEVETGLILKAASWKAPAKNFSRGSLEDLHKESYVVSHRFGF